LPVVGVYKEKKMDVTEYRLVRVTFLGRAHDCRQTIWHTIDLGQHALDVDAADFTDEARQIIGRYVDVQQPVLRLDYLQVAPNGVWNYSPFSERHIHIPLTEAV